VNAPPTYHREHVRAGPLSISTQIYQGLGALPDTYKNFAFGSLLLFYYNQVLGLPAARASFALMLALVIDAIADPLVGSLSDNFQSRLGRRHPFMYASALPLGTALTLTFLPPARLSQDGLFAWLLACTIATRVAMTFFLVPWSALYAELTDDYAERSTVVMWRYLVGWTGGVAFAFAVFTFVFPSSPEYTPGHLNPRAYATFAPLLGGLVAAAVLLTTHLTVREIPYLLQPVPVGARPRFASFVSELGLAARNRDFLLLVAGILVSAAIAGTGGALDIYMTTYFWGLRPEELRWFGMTIVGAVAAFALVPVLQARIEKHHLLAVCALFNLVNGFIVVGLRFAGALPENGDPLLLPILIVNSIVRVAADTLIGVMFASMVADTLDAQELAAGRRQEGLFAGALSFAAKATSGFGVMIGGLLLEYVIAMPMGAKPATLDAAVIRRIGIVAGFCLPLFYLLPISGIRFYRITRARHAAIRAKLAERHN
jgi:GPH family glycoside/pentoside/hexuronide:cation symporter